MTSIALRLNDETNYRCRSPHRSSPRIRSRSRAIAIQSSHPKLNKSHHELLEEIRVTEAAAEYDWATWRMYNRIIDHRQKNPVKYQHEEEDEDESIRSSSAGIPKNMRACISNHASSNDNLHHSNSRNALKETIDYIDDYGEVFDFEL